MNPSAIDTKRPPPVPPPMARPSAPQMPAMTSMTISPVIVMVMESMTAIGAPTAIGGIGGFASGTTAGRARSRFVPAAAPESVRRGPRRGASLRSSATLDRVSKAFTKEDDGVGIAPVESQRVPTAPFRLTPDGARALGRSADPRAREALARAEIVKTEAGTPERAAIGVFVRVREEDDRERVYHLVSAEEHVLVGEGCSVHSPVGGALLGARVGDVREVTTPRGTEELEVTHLSFAPPAAH
jgi:hypothetical protein